MCYQLQTMMNSRKIVCHTLSTRFRECTSIVTHTLGPLKQGQVLVQVHYCGINASDINYTNGAYLPGISPPFDCGFEAVGVILQLGPGVKKFKVGDAVVSMGKVFIFVLRVILILVLYSLWGVCRTRDSKRTSSPSCAFRFTCSSSYHSLWINSIHCT